MNPPTPPIILDEHGDVEFYASTQAAEGDLEAIDVRAGEYEAFDSVGQRLLLNAEGEIVHIVVDHATTPDPLALRYRLEGFVQRVGPHRVGVNATEADLPELIDALTRFFGIE